MKHILILILILLTGCTARERHLIWPHMAAVEGDKGRFRAVTFDMVEGSPGFSILLPDGKILRSSDLSGPWQGEKVILYDRGFVLLTLRDGQVRHVDVEIPHWQQPAINEPEIGNATASVFYSMPITRPQLEALFGPPLRTETHTRGLIVRSNTAHP